MFSSSLKVGIRLTCFLMALGSSQYSFASLFETDLHHSFNAGQLKQGEHQISVVGNYKYGLTDQLEVGSQGTFLLLSTPTIPNIYVNHRMFNLEKSKTNFTSHMFYFDNSLLGYAALKNSFALGKSTVLSVSVFNYFALSVQDSWLRDEIDVSNFYLPAVNLDQQINENWAFSALAKVAVYGRLESTADSIEIEADYFILRDVRELAAFGMATFTAKVSDMTYLEFGGGAVGYDGNIAAFPYFNVFWRIPK